MRWAPREAAWAAVAGRVLSEGSREPGVGRGALWTGGKERGVVSLGRGGVGEGRAFGLLWERGASWDGPERGLSPRE